MKLRGAIWMVIALAPVAALGDDPPAPSPPPMGVWTGKGQLGFMASQGNSVAKSANAALDMSYLQDAWKHALHLALLYAQSAGVVSAERYTGLWQTNYTFSPSLYTFGALRYERDLFNGFQYQANGTAGIGYKLIDSGTVKLSAQLGAGYAASRPESLTYNSVGAITSRALLPYQGYAIGTAGLDYSQQLTSTTTLSDTFLLYSGTLNSLITNNLVLSVKMSKKLAVSVGYDVQENTNPPRNVKSIDTVETINLVYSF